MSEPGCRVCKQVIQNMIIVIVVVIADVVVIDDALPTPSAPLSAVPDNTGHGDVAAALMVNI